RPGTAMAAHPLRVRDAVAPLEERHQRPDELLGRDVPRIEYRAHLRGLPAGQGRAVQPQQAHPDEQSRDGADDRAVSLEHEIQRRAAAAALEPLDPRPRVDDAAVLETSDQLVPIVPLERRGFPDEEHFSPPPRMPESARARTPGTAGG